MNYKYLLYAAIIGYLSLSCYRIEGTIPVQKIDSVIPIQTTNISASKFITEDPIPISDYKKPYEMEKIGYFWRASDGQSYINSEHEVVQWFTRNTEIENGVLYYKNTDKRVVSKYYPDIDNDYWQNADYYLSHGLYGDCEDYAIAIASILESKNIPNMIVFGFQTSINDRHVILEYYYDDKYYTTDIVYGLYMERKELEETGWIPKMMFNKFTDYTSYKNNWYV